jgi:hypothetical protein
LVTSVRGIGFSPITSPSAALGVMGFMKAALAFRAVFFFAVLAIKSPLESRGSSRHARGLCDTAEAPAHSVA